MRKRHLTQSYIATCFKGYSWRGIDDGHWRLLKDLHENAKSVIKWEGNISQPFQVNQGVKQGGILTDTCFIQKIYAPSSSLLQGKHLPFTPSPHRLNIFRLFVILSLTQLYRYTAEIFLFSTATFKYEYRAPLRRIGQEYSAKVAFSIFQSLKRIQSLPVSSKLI
jgi:hypothetical protein